MTDPSRDVDNQQVAVHRPVLLREVLKNLALEPGLTVLDGTVGAGGHSRAILDVIGSTGTVIGFDRDPMMLRLAEQAIEKPAEQAIEKPATQAIEKEPPKTTPPENVYLIHASYSHMGELQKPLEERQFIESNFFQQHRKQQAKGTDNSVPIFESVDRILLDLGLSSDQLADRKRGFGITTDGPLDLRFDNSTGLPAWKFLEKQTAEQIATIINDFGEDRFSRSIAAEIKQQQAQQKRQNQSLKTVENFVSVIHAALPRAVPGDARKKSVIRVFQAMRIAVNNELEHLQTVLNETINNTLITGGRVAVISFHSLEDRLVKNAFRDKKQWENLTPKPITATALEKRMNPRCRTAKLRVAIKK